MRKAWKHRFKKKQQVSKWSRSEIMGKNLNVHPWQKMNGRLRCDWSIFPEYSKLWAAGAASLVRGLLQKGISSAEEDPSALESQSSPSKSWRPSSRQMLKGISPGLAASPRVMYEGYAMRQGWGVSPLGLGSRPTQAHSTTCQASLVSVSRQFALNQGSQWQKNVAAK